MNFSAVVFDMEGTLVDCLVPTLECWRETFQEAGYKVSYREIQPLFGMDGMWMLNRILPQETRDTKERLLKLHGERYRRDYLRRTKPLPGVRQLLMALHQAGVRIGIATTCQKEELAIYAERLGIVDLTDAVVCGEAAKHGKPDPSLFEQCLSQLEVAHAAQAVAIGDTPYDAMAAKNLGMAAVGVLTGGFSKRALHDAGCDYVFKDVQDARSLWNSGSRSVLASG